MDAAASGECFATAALRAAHLASAVLGWLPEQFWRATPAELRTALGLDVEARSILDRSTFERMMETFPDG